MIKLPVQPWYREPWPWLLMSGPAAVIVAGVFTAVLAFRSSDGLVADDYYKQGLAINRTIAREERAAALGISADLSYVRDASRVRVALTGVAPAVLTLRLAHPTRAGFDQVVVLTQVQPGLYEGALRPVDGGRWLAVLETADWRLAGDWKGSQRTTLHLGGVGTQTR